MLGAGSIAQKPLIAAREALDELLPEIVVVPFEQTRIDALFIHLARTIDVVLEPIVDVPRPPALLADFLVLELDLADQKACQTPRFLVQGLFALRDGDAFRRRPEG